MLIKKRWVRRRGGDGLWPDTDEIEHDSWMIGWFLFGIIPIYIRQEAMWK